MKEKNKPRQESENKSNQYSIEYPKITAPWVKLFNVLGFVASILIFFSACKEDEELIPCKTLITWVFWFTFISVYFLTTTRFF